MLLMELRKRVYEANMELLYNNLVRWTSGNASAIDEKTRYVVIKPSGVKYKDLSPENMVIVDLEGNIIEGDLKPSVDTASHLYVYRHRKDIAGIIHTHSPYATSFAVRGEDLEIFTTTSAAQFGKTIKCSGFALIGEEEIGKEIIDKIGDNSAILIKNHGVFTIGNSVESALKSAVLLEETAEVVHFAKLRGSINKLDKKIIEEGYRRYHSQYGQKNNV
ncbi:L-ribulose-5-phosphate 4-epimerase [Oceanivirga salmonicida]|uniref:L-ribulose-5-phosphate 4-epimerase n=1 Tax=Oceanivirga salmonicida TaxID=1769291 RepID=UPI00082975BA|nr:L-ribulose-5-phosphate 4-epimerase [Oceanivirga salmonicida]